MKEKSNEPSYICFYLDETYPCIEMAKIMSVKHINTQLCYDFSKTKIIQKFKTADQWALSFMKMGYNALLKKGLQV